jgi:hypothetical protein
MRASRPLLTIAAIAAALTLAACGGDDDDSGGSEDSDQITEVIQTSVTTTDPADCERLQTENFLEQVQFSSGPDALENCQADAEDTEDDPDETEVTNIEVDGASATADASFVGGPFDGSTITLALVKEGDQWKLDRIEDIPEFDFEAFQAGFAESLSSELPQEAVTCITDAFTAAGPDQVEAALLSGEEAQVNALFADCIGG